MRTLRFQRFVAGCGLLVLASASISACGASGTAALDPPLLEGPEATEAVQNAREPKVLYGPGQDVSGESPLFIVDGQIVDDETMRLLDGRPDLFESVRVFKSEQATARFGAEGENGVIEITLKEPLSGLLTPVDSSG